MLFILAIYGFLSVSSARFTETGSELQLRPCRFGSVVARTNPTGFPKDRDLCSISSARSAGCPRATIRLNDEHVSARHAEIARGSNGSWLLRGAGQHQRHTLERSTHLRPGPGPRGDLIELGTIALRLEPLD